MADYRYSHSSKTLSQARTLRRRMTEVEKKLWSRLRAKRLQGYKFRRQYPIGQYVLDFYCSDKKVAVELDGSQHMEEKNKQHDDNRTMYLMNEGILVLRYWNNQVNEHLEGVLEEILSALKRR